MAFRAVPRPKSRIPRGGQKREVGPLYRVTHGQPQGGKGRLGPAAAAKAAMGIHGFVAR